MSSVGNLVRVWTDVGSRKPVPLLAKVVEENGCIFTIRYLSESDDKIWRYEEDTYEIDNDSISEYLKTSDEHDVGFKPFDDGFVKVESDDDYVPSDEDEETDDDSLTDDSDEEDEEDEFEDDEEDEEDEAEDEEPEE
jgi:hypothetical protein